MDAAAMDAAAMDAAAMDAEEEAELVAAMVNLVEVGTCKLNELRVELCGMQASRLQKVAAKNAYCGFLAAARDNVHLQTEHFGLENVRLKALLCELNVLGAAAVETFVG